jgi:diacylglycerol kinase (ATP)
MGSPGIENKPSRPKRVLIVFNPIAGRRRKKLFAKTVDALNDRGCLLDVQATQGPGDAIRIARDAVTAGNFDAIVAAGGDGTINEVIQGMTCTGQGPAGDAPSQDGIYSGPAFATIPFGTVNVLALDIGLEQQADAMADTIVGTAEVAATIGVAKGENVDRTFLITAGVGLDSAAVKYLKPGLKRVFSWGAYILSMIMALVRDGDVELDAQIDGEAVRGSTIIITNVSRFGGPHVVAPEARVEGDKLTVLVALGFGRKNLLRYGIAFALGKVPDIPDKILRDFDEVRITAPKGYPTQIDGDGYGTVPVTFRAAPARLRLLVPEGYGRGG